MLSTEALPSQRQQLEPSHSSTGSFFAPVNHFLDRPSHHRRQNAARKAREDALIEEANRAATIEKSARSEAEQASRGLARSYLEHFLQTSEWQDHTDRIGVVDEAVPTMEELESYGSLDEAEGTRACRKMFKAVVVWEKVGHSLWQRLREGDEKTDSRVFRAVGHDAAAVPQLQDSQQAEGGPRRQSYHHDCGSRDLYGLSVIKEQPSEPQGHPPARRTAEALLPNRHHARVPARSPGEALLFQCRAAREESSAKNATVATTRIMIVFDEPPIQVPKWMVDGKVRAVHSDQVKQP
ncbi:hypothetical protein NLU13_6601 [Sarocladium strictum]|uniref:Uncharacterized protein n=1 Tax=Sarocladium strictum TaxID=5046 RepID=A0AA39L7G1_SARSR|nr:hypothetical protein NLU13_6601 [Sarocladium strictum]